MWSKKFVKVKKNSWFWTLFSSRKLFNKELRINYVPEIWNGCNVWEQVFRHYCLDPLVFHRWGYTWARMSCSQRRTWVWDIRFELCFYFPYSGVHFEKLICKCWFPSGNNVKVHRIFSASAFNILLSVSKLTETVEVFCKDWKHGYLSHFKNISIGEVRYGTRLTEV